MRDYDPTTGRYIQADPLGLVDGASVYGYALQSPMRWTDPTGEFAQAFVYAAVTGAVGGVVTGALIDHAFGDGCYTLGEAGRDALLGAAFGGVGAGIARGYRVWKASRGSRVVTIVASGGRRNVSAIGAGAASLSASQSNVLSKLPSYGASTIVSKGSFGLKDLTALTAATGDEFAMFTTGGRRLLVRGSTSTVPITPQMGSELAKAGWRWSAHSHPFGSLMSSSGDRAVLSVFRNSQSAIVNGRGARSLFTSGGDSLSGWLP
ncbi:hypothetical protein jaqu_09480 [Jannaschia aquimarina]|uniref:Uncharacterized protein n=2 Tax=Jannaschia aquimarina TaxID=935700 RepID=A0A0D1CR15_9RHOB|nr:hypothetical protein jaqu_09480 [Jannaschia aquimarina]SNT18587.1 RHS repeat-associated core domain-containing protein [Jannaschia aquimarina]